MRSSVFDSYVMLKETEHFKVCYDPNYDPIASYVEEMTYVVVYKPLGLIEHAASSFTTACSLLWAAEMVFESNQKLFEVDGFNKKPADGNTIN